MQKVFLSFSLIVGTAKPIVLSLSIECRMGLLHQLLEFTWLIVYYFSPCNLHRDETLSTLLFMLFVLSAWPYAPVKISSVSFFSVPGFSLIQVSWPLTSDVFLINWECNDFLIKFLFLASRTFIFAFPRVRIPFHSIAFRSLTMLLFEYFFRLFFHLYTIFNTNHFPSTTVPGYVEPINISLKLEWSVN